MNNIIGEFYYYNPQENKAAKLPNMSQKRYTHMSIFHKNVFSYNHFNFQRNTMCLAAASMEMTMLQ